MDTRKLQEAVDELQTEGNRCLRLAEELKAVIKRSANGSGQIAALPLGRFKRKGKKASLLTLALEVLRQEGKPTHIKDIVAKVAMKAERHIGRASLEAALIRALAVNKVRRPERGTYDLA